MTEFATEWAMDDLPVETSVTAEKPKSPMGEGQENIVQALHAALETAVQ